MSEIKKIMIVDDDAAILDAISILLEFEGFEVICRNNGEQLFKEGNQLPDLLLLDIWLSGLDGRDLCRQLKQQENTRHLPVIMLSASRDVESSARQAGADDFIAKPFEINDLVKKINKFEKK